MLCRLVVLGGCLALVGVAGAEPAPVRTDRELARLMARGGEVFEAGNGCKRWRVVPKRRGRPRGSLRMEGRDAEGFEVSFRYALDRDGKLTLTGPGYAVPRGVSVPVPDQPGWFTFGRASYCVSSDPLARRPDGAFVAAKVGWFTDPVACAASPEARQVRTGCLKSDADDTNVRP